MTLEPGKKYTYQYSHDKYLCVGISNRGKPILENIKTENLFRVENSSFKDYSEYKEPVVHTRYIHWYYNDEGQVKTYTLDCVNMKYSGVLAFHVDKIEYIEK